jgi:hypothetical protein
MAPTLQLNIVIADVGALAVPVGEATRGTRAAWRHGHFAPKFAPDHRNFGAGRVGLI